MLFRILCICMAVLPYDFVGGFLNRNGGRSFFRKFRTREAAVCGPAQCVYGLLCALEILGRSVCTYTLVDGGLSCGSLSSMGGSRFLDRYHKVVFPCKIKKRNKKVFNSEVRALGPL